MEELPTTQVYYLSCVGSFTLSVLLLAIGLWNAPLLPSEKGFYAITFFLSLFGAIAVQKNVRDHQQEGSGKAESFTREPVEAGQE